MNFDDRQYAGKRDRSIEDQWKALAFGNRPPMSPGQQANTASNPPDGLTPVFNHSAKAKDGPAPKLRIDPQKVAKNLQKLIAEKRAKMSSPKPTLEPSPFGSVNRSINKDLDRKLAKQINALEATLQKQLAKTQKPESMTPKASKYDLKRNFNKSSMGRGL